MDKLKKVVYSADFLFGLLAFLLPLVFYWSVFFTRSFGFDCAPGVTGNNGPWQQPINFPNLYCLSIHDPGAYVWQHPAHWAEAMRQYLNGSFPIWTQNIAFGFPLAANFQSQAFFILGFPFWLMFYISKGNLFHLDLFFTFRYMVMSLGMYLFIRSFGIRRIVSYLGSLSFFSAGYFIMVPNIAHHAVDMLLPYVGWAINRFYITNNTKWIGIGILALGLSMLGGMPEVSIFILFFSGIYTIFSSIVFAKNKVRAFMWGSLITIGGLLVSAVLYLPGFEYVLQGSSAHHDGSGVQKYLPFQYITTFIFPELFGGYMVKNEMASFFTEHNIGVSWNYLGTILSFLYITSFFFIPSFLKDKNKKFLFSYYFFAGLGMILVLQNYGILRNFVFENFPVFHETQFTKYAAALISFSIITSVCLFLEMLSERKSKVFVAGTVIAVAICLWLNQMYVPFLRDKHFMVIYAGLIPNIFYALIFISIITAGYFLLKRKFLFLAVVFLLVLAEYYIYFPKHSYQMRYESFRTPPAIQFLQQKNDNSFRIIGTENILYPNLSAFYDLNDIRMLDALWIGRTYDFYKHFFAEPEVFRITGLQETAAPKPAEVIFNDFFDLMSVKYLVSYKRIESQVNGNIISEFVKQNPEKQFQVKIFGAGLDQQNVLFMHAPSSGTVKVMKPAGAENFVLYPVFDPQVFDKLEGDGAVFTVSATDEAGLVVLQNQRFANPSTNKEDQKWQKLLLGPFPNSEKSYEVTINLSVEPGLTDAFDWTGWAGLYWDVYETQTAKEWKPVYNKEMIIYEKTDFLPRLRLIGQTVCVKPDKENEYKNVVNAMKLHAENIRNTAIVESDSCESQKFSTSSATLNNISYKDSSVSFSYTSKTPQYGFLADAYYPGWEVYINGKKGRIDPANLAFRGFALPAGKDVKVDIVYQPTTYKVGIPLTAIGLVLAVILIRRNRKLKI